MRKSPDSRTINALLPTDFPTRKLFKLGITVFVGCPEGCRYYAASAIYDLLILLHHFSTKQVQFFQCDLIVDFYPFPCFRVSVFPWNSPCFFLLQIGVRKLTIGLWRMKDFPVCRTESKIMWPVLMKILLN